jgi:hypothetical protein
MPAITTSANISPTIDPYAGTRASPPTPHGDVADDDDLGIAKGIVFGLLLGLAIWASVIGYFFFR